MCEGLDLFRYLILYHIYPLHNIYVKICIKREELNHANYILDTVYRTVSFSKSSYLPRSYNQFINEDMGQKK